MAIIFHADDFGITSRQAQEIISLTRTYDGALSSVSIFANSPAFEKAATIARPSVENESLSMALHANIVEGFPCADPESIPLLTGDRGTFVNDFAKLLLLSFGPKRAQLRNQIVREFSSQIAHYLEAFPEQAASFKVDTHQHVHAIPLVLDALLEAIEENGCALGRLRVPTEPVMAHVTARSKGAFSANLAKDVVISALTRNARSRLPKSCSTPAFCGVVLSGKMESLSDGAIALLAKQAADSGRDLEVLFHPVSVPMDECLDPRNEPFARACASEGRDTEATRLRELKASFPV